MAGRRLIRTLVQQRRAWWRCRRERIGPRRGCGGHEAFSLGRCKSRHDRALRQILSTLPASRASRKFVLLARLPAQGTLARFIFALLVGGVSITWPKTPRSVARIKLAKEVGG